MIKEELNKKKNREHVKKYREKNKEKIAQKNHEYYMKNKAKFRGYFKEYCEKHKNDPEFIKKRKEYARKTYQKNREKRLLNNKKYYENHKEKFFEYYKEYNKKRNNESKKFAEKVKTRWNEEEINIVLEEYMNYSKIIDIAKKVKRTNASVSNMITKLRKEGRIPNEFRNKRRNTELLSEDKSERNIAS